MVEENVESSFILCASDNDVEKSVALFRFVRDQVRYRLGLYRDSASDTLQQRSGSCSNKANLLVALLRAAGIPAGFHVLQVKTKEYFGPLCSMAPTPIESAPHSETPTRPTTEAPAMPRRGLSKRWRELTYRIYDIVSLTCGQCRGEMKILAFITGPNSIRKILDHRDNTAAEPRAPPSTTSD